MNGKFRSYIFELTAIQAFHSYKLKYDKFWIWLMLHNNEEMSQNRFVPLFFTFTF
jgi:hypothetical protein